MAYLDKKYLQLIRALLPEVRKISETHGVRGTLALAVICQESMGDWLAFADLDKDQHPSMLDSIGLMQVRQTGALADYNVAHGTNYTWHDMMFNPLLNIEVGSWYLGQRIKQYNDETKALQAYNQGMGTVSKDQYAGLWYAQGVKVHEQTLLKLITE